MNPGTPGGTSRSLSPIAGTAGTGLNNARAGANQAKPHPYSPSAAQTPEMPSADLVAVPVTSLYDHGTTLVPSEVLDPRIPMPFLALNPADADKQKATDGMTVSVRVNAASATVVVKVDENVPAGFALVPRSMGISIQGPAPIEIRVAEGELA